MAQARPGSFKSFKSLKSLKSFKSLKNSRPGLRSPPSPRRSFRVAQARPGSFKSLKGLKSLKSLKSFTNLQSRKKFQAWLEESPEPSEGFQGGSGQAWKF